MNNDDVLRYAETKVDEIIGPDGIKIAVQPKAPVTADIVAWVKANPVPSAVGGGLLGLALWRLVR